MDPSQPPPVPLNPYDAPAPPPGAPSMQGYPPGYVPGGPSYEVAYATPPWALPGKPRIWTVFVAFVAAFGPGCIAAGVVAVGMAVVLHGRDVLDPSAPEHQERIEGLIREPPIFLPMLLATQVVLTGVALCAAYLSPTPLTRRLRLGRPKLPWYGYPILALGTLALGYTFGVLIELLGFGDQGVLKEFETVMTGLRGGVLIAAAAVIGLAPGFGEELLFRGYIQTRLQQRWRRLVALLVTSFLFGLIHFDPVQSTMAVGLGMWLGELADRTGSIWPAVVGHAFNNAVATVMSALIPPETDTADAWVMLMVTVPVFALCLVYLLRRPVMPVEVDVPPTAPPPDFAVESPFRTPPPGLPGAG